MATILFPTDMKPLAVLHLPLIFSAVLLSACQSTVPTAQDLDQFQKEATVMANRQIALLDAQLAKKQISKVDHDADVAALRANIPAQADALAWTRHELTESRKRAYGIPTGDTTVPLGSPGQGYGSSFYRPASNPNAGLGGPGGTNLQVSPPPEAVRPVDQPVDTGAGFVTED